jgi:hypothetical protein
LRRLNAPFGERRCRVCGCHAYCACFSPDLGPCGWVSEDLCSHCVPRVAAKRWRRLALSLAAGVAFGILLVLPGLWAILARLTHHG